MDTQPNSDFFQRSEFGGQSQLFIDEARKEVAMGIMFHFNVTDQLKLLMEKNKVVLPENIRQIDVLAIAPDESFPERSHIHESPNPTTEELSGKRWIWKDKDPSPMYYSVINKLFRDSKEGKPEIEQIANTLASLIIEVSDPHEAKFGRDGEEKNKGTKLLIIEGHGGGIPHILGERTDIGKDKAYVAREEGDLNQKPGNHINTDELIKKFDQPNIYTDIFVNACNNQEAVLSPTHVPVHYVFGTTSSFRPAYDAQVTAKAPNSKT